jgi:hypothetical protein
MRYNLVGVNVSECIKCAAHCPEFCEEIQNQIDMRSFQIKEGSEYFPSNFSPDLVLKIIKKYIASLPYTSKHIILYNYPSADLRC